MVKLIYYGELKSIAGHEADTAEAAKLKDVLRYISKTYGKEAYKTARQALITVDGVRCYEPGAALPDGSTVSFFPFCIGG